MMGRGRETVHMHVRQVLRDGRRLSAPLCLTLAAASAVVLAGCGHSSPSAAVVKNCGASRTAANVPIDVLIERGQVACSAALAVEKGYAKAIVEGKAPGAGGGGPVPVNGWTCQGYPTPEVLKTGKTSRCVKHGAEILAVLKTSS
jgi:hypothetical protein